MDGTIYKALRNERKMSRDKVCDYIVDNSLGRITPERLERIENGKFSANPDEVILLSKVYKDPSLCNHYCTNECDIGRIYVPEIKMNDLEKIVLPMIASLNSMKNKQERLIEITSDGAIEDEELKDFIAIQNELEKISVAVKSLQLWTEQMIADGKIDMERYNALKRTEETEKDAG